MAIANIEELENSTEVLVSDLYGLSIQLDSLFDIGENNSQEWIRIKGLYDTTMVLYETASGEEAQRDDTRIDSVQNEIITIITLDSCIQILKDVYEIKLRLMKNDTLSANDLDYLREIAALCPAGNGESVFLARSMLSLYENIRYPSMEDCLSAQVGPRSQKTSKEDMDKFSVYPNPATDEVFIRMNLSKDESGEISIIDIQGNELKRYIVNTGKDLMKIETNTWTSGIYLIKFVSESGVETVKKLMISK